MPQVLVAAAQVDHLDALAGRAFAAVFEVLLGREDVVAGKVRGPVFLAFDNNDYLA